MTRPGIPFGWSLGSLLKLGLFLGSALLVVGVFLFTRQTIAALTHEVSTTSRVLARFLAQSSYQATYDPQLEQIVSDVIGSVDFPLIVTDRTGTPRAWRHVGVDPALVPVESIDSLSQRLPIAPVIRERIDRVRARIAELDRRNPPIPMTLPGVPVGLGQVHYGEPPVLGRLRWMPFVSLAGVLGLLAIGLWGLAVLRQAEKRTIWVGMAKETAHQLGTPLSSLMGWVELLRERSAAAGAAPDPDLDEAVSEMGRDVDRLTKVAQRFSRVGSAPELSTGDVTPVVREVVGYMRRRSPRGSGEVEIRERYQPVPPVRLNAELLEWALENLLANALTALDKRPGVIEVRVGPAGRGVEIAVEDNGRGMAPAERRRAFEPGFTTKRRGWGLGLALARRVVEEYHGGRIVVAQTAPGRGTTLVVTLDPAAGSG